MKIRSGWLAPLLAFLFGCSSTSQTCVSVASDRGAGATAAGGSGGKAGGAATSDAGHGGAAPKLPLCIVRDVDLPGKAVRFDYQDIDAQKGHLVIAHMNDASVVVVDLADGKTVKVIPNVPTARGVIVADDIGRIFVTSSPNKVVVIDNDSLAVVATVTSGNGPDGIGWDPVHKVVGVSDQGDGALSLIADSGLGKRTQVKLGVETGNVIFDPTRGLYWITVVTGGKPDQLVSVDPIAATIQARLGLPGCEGAHGLRVAPDGKTALIACEGNSKVARADLVGAAPIVIADAGSDPDVLAVDPALGWLYVSAESGDLKVFDLNQPGLALLGSEHPGDHSHTVAVDVATHRVFLPLQSGPNGTPVLRIMKPTGS